MGQYFVTNVHTCRRLHPTFWSHAIEPGDELTMTMILDDVEAEKGYCPYKSCGELTTGIPLSGRGRICPNCFRFAVISRKKMTYPKSCGQHDAPNSSHDPLVPGPDSELTPGETATFEEVKEAGLPPPLLPQANIYEEEDIELYHSIQVAQTLLIDEYETSLKC
ncbi:uncharacterized protein Z519_05442 [Cladophialophora bantiana CBS 173.52]|uniref:Uncharacterized protein n=1 Tax=Cladophialophora bantiana (strain ATCC 10958 / CBS 173.52 / CDC B-1940 / NIH 8579) TaxID=1442370 RepID=A0A0D2EWB2_CLAB1|nr:uncharacterized protein Z519_05442 [Cladophialophora bantiana CBS 173.52]KIW94126.1 hypothetical protein Z519_05442 [Cladophialophora bantiana CBS 173.52]